MKRKWILYGAAVMVTAAVFFLVWDVMTHKDYIDAFSGATPVALQREVPDGLRFTVEGKVKQKYTFSSHSFRLLAKARIRTPEVTPAGEIMGTYIYTGIPVLYILEGVVPLKTGKDAFDRPLDMVAVFHSATGKTACFSYGELVMAGDSFPVTLAYHREPLMPTKGPGAYTKNKYRENIRGLRLIAPAEQDNTRWLDDVVRLTLEAIPTPDHLLPPLQKWKNCSSETVTCLDGENQRLASVENVPLIQVSNWFRVGHGRGIKGDRLAAASGFHLRTFLMNNFPGTLPAAPGDFFLFVGCDGYRCIFSSREIFCTPAGDTFMMIDTIDGVKPKGGQTVGPMADFFVDRDVWGVTHILKVKLKVPLIP